ncbi:MAG: Asp-tRNA(Asn)/Glu-tRNA(Gln) amidotransferase subunit GatA [Tissierellia bacterium]|nr:Asp-tRNA(Asn)/Glu-tRNA(Gln) amidotransferase subunit GatA [Tissierellia bacterium]
MDITSLKAWEMKEKIIKKEISCKEVIQAHIKKIEEEDSEINAFISLNKEEALRKSEKIDEKIKKGEGIGLLSGLPIGIKDNIASKDLKTTCGSKMLDKYISPFNATVVEKIINNDGIIIGKTNMDEFALGDSTETSYFGPTKNPINKNVVPGGSSGGSAAAVAANMVALSLGTDTGGSVRQPASFCGIVGIKPSYGMISRYGVIPMADTLDHVGVFGRDVRDATLILDSLKGYDKKDSTSSKMSNSEAFSIVFEEDKGRNYLDGMKVAIPREYIDLVPADKKVQEQFDKAIKVFEKSGAKIEIVSIPHLKYAAEVYYIIMSCEVSSNMARYDGIAFGHRAEEYETLDELYINSRTEAFGKEAKTRILAGTYALTGSKNAELYQKAMKVRRLLKEDYDKVFASHDVVLSLSSKELPFELNSIKKTSIESYKLNMYSAPANLAGLCAMSIPIGEVDGLPVGMEITGDRFKDRTIIKAGIGYERAVL